MSQGDVFDLEDKQQAVCPLLCAQDTLRQPQCLATGGISVAAVPDAMQPGVEDLGTWMLTGSLAWTVKAV